MNKVKEVSMGFTSEKFFEGTHACLIYTSEKERLAIISKFIQSGLQGGEKVGYFAEDMTSEQFIDWLKSLNISIDDTDQLQVSRARDTYCPHNRFDPQVMLENLRHFYLTATKEKYCGARVSGEMKWALQNFLGSERLMEYEALINTILETHPVTAICQYDANCFDGKLIMDALRVHPMMIVRGRIVRNPYYMKPEEFLSEFSERTNNGASN